MCDSVERLSHLKSQINQMIKIVNIEFKGKNKYQKKINIGNILNKYGSTEIIPESEEFYFFDFNMFETNINLNCIREDLRNEALIELNIIHDYYRNYVERLQLMNNIEENINSLVVGKVWGKKIIWADDIDEVCRLADRFNEEKSNFNRCNILEMLNYCAKHLRTTIYYELYQRGTREETIEINESINRLLAKNTDIGNYIDSLEVRCSQIYDISHEILTNRDMVRGLSKILPQEVIILLEEYYNLARV